MAPVNVSLIDPQSNQAFEVSTDPVKLLDLMGLINALTKAGVYKPEPDPQIQPDGSVRWLVNLRPLTGGGDTLHAYEGYWIVVDANLTPTVYDGPTALGLLQGDAPLEWAATTTAPTVTLNADGTVTLGFRQPTSINGPWTYTVAATDTADNSTAPTPVIGDPVVTVAKADDGWIQGADATLNVAGPPPGHSHSYTVTVIATKYDTTATSPPTQTVTAATT